MGTVRLILAAHVVREQDTYNYLVDGKRVTLLEFSRELREASLADKLVHVVTQSTGFGWRTVWEIVK